MSGFLRIAILWLVVFLFFSCEKEKLIKNEDNFIEQTEGLSALKVEASAVGLQFIEVQWSEVRNTHFKSVTYSIYLDDQKIVSGLTTTKYSLINLKPGKAYAIKILASVTGGKQVEEMLVANTLSSTTGESKQTLYQEYKIHSYSTFMGPTALQKCFDGGHLVVRFLQHPNYFGDGSFKLIVFKIDQYGQMLWYRLIPTLNFNFSTFDNINLILYNQDKEGLIFIQGYAFKIATSNGEIIGEKNFQSILNKQTVQSVYYESPQEVIAGTVNGNLLSINPQNLSVNWHQINPDRLGTIVAIRMDSKKNIYYIFRNQNDQNYKIRIHKCNAKGDFLSEFLFDGRLNAESNYGFWMTALLVDDQDNFYLFGHNSSFDYLRYFKFSADGTVLKKNEQSDNLLAKQAFFNSKGEIFLLGAMSPGGLQTYGGIYVYDKDMKLKSKRFYTEIPYHVISGITGNLDGSYNIFLHYMQTYNYENSNFVFIKTDADGKM